MLISGTSLFGSSTNPFPFLASLISEGLLTLFHSGSFSRAFCSTGTTLHVSKVGCLITTLLLVTVLGHSTMTNSEFIAPAEIEAAPKCTLAPDSLEEDDRVESTCA